MYAKLSYRKKAGDCSITGFPQSGQLCSVILTLIDVHRVSKALPYAAARLAEIEFIVSLQESFKRLLNRSGMNMVLKSRLYR